MNSHLTSGIPMIRFPFSFLYVKRKGMPQGTHQKHRGHHQLTGYYGQQLDPVAEGYLPCLRAITTTALLVKTTEKIVVGYLLAIFVLHIVRSLLNSYHAQHFSASHFTCYEVLLLTVAHITLLRCNSLNLAMVLASVTDEVLRDCLTLINLIPLMICRKFHWATLVSHGLLMDFI